MLSAALALYCGAFAAQAPRPTYETTKVEGTEHVGRPEGGATYLQEIKKVTDQPVRYMVYSHHHYHHIAGARPLPDEVFAKSRTLSWAAPRSS